MITRHELAQKMAKKPDQELLAMLASPDDWTAEALAAGKAELGKRGLNMPDHRSSLAIENSDDQLDRDDRPDIYEFCGRYPNCDARVLLDAFVKEGIGFTLDVDKMGVAAMSASQAAYGGTFGEGVGMAIGVHTDDYDQAMLIRQRVLRILP